MPTVLPIEQTHPELAEQIRQIVAGEHPVRGFDASWHTRHYVLRDGSVVTKRSRLAGATMPGRNDDCPCESGQKFKKCCLRRI